MKKLYASLLLIAASASVLAQQFCAPGACWTYSDGQNGARYWHIGDTIVNGVTFQVCALEHCWIDGLGVYHCGGFNEPLYEYSTMQGDVVLAGVNSPAGLDTMYWLGVPGDRWWAPGSEEFCDGYNWMLQIQDTGSIVIDGVNLRTWDVVRLSQNGTPYPGTPTTITERIGAAPRYFCPIACSVIVDCYFYQLVHYSDGEISIPTGVTCSIAMDDAGELSMGALRVLPNPGVDQLTISGLAGTGTLIDVRDAIGGTILTHNAISDLTRIDTDGWPPGTYIITITSSDQRKVIKWVKQ